MRRKMRAAPPGTICRMSESNVIPFRRRPPTPVEIEYYRMMTRSWHPAVRQQVFPEHFELDQRDRRDAE